MHMTTQLDDWKLYLAYIAKENKKIERYNKKQWDKAKVRQKEEDRLSDEWEKQDKLKREAYETKQADKRREYFNQPWYKKLGDDGPFMMMPYLSYNPYKWHIFYPMNSRKLLQPSYEEFLTMLSKGELK